MKTDEFSVRPVAYMHSPFQFHHGTPRQPRVGTERDGEIHVEQGYQNLLQDLDGFSHIWVVFWCNYARGWNDLVTPPRDTVKRGLFSTRAPHRPNPIGISALELRRIDRRVVHVGAHDILNGTPILDLKPYIPAYDSIPTATAGWLASLPTDDRPDHREWRDPTDPLAIRAFLSSPSFAVVGASPDRTKFGNRVLRKYLEHNLPVVAVHPRETSIEGVTAYPTLSAIPTPPAAISIITPPAITETVVTEALALGIRHIWMQPGADSPAAIAAADEAGANVIHGGACLLIELV